MSAPIKVTGPKGQLDPALPRRQHADSEHDFVLTSGRGRLHLKLTDWQIINARTIISCPKSEYSVRYMMKQRVGTLVHERLQLE